jgi:hypothetical protein
VVGVLVGAATLPFVLVPVLFPVVVLTGSSSGGGSGAAARA